MCVLRGGKGGVMEQTGKRNFSRARAFCSALTHRGQTIVLIATAFGLLGLTAVERRHRSISAASDVQQCMRLALEVQ